MGAVPGEVLLGNDLEAVPLVQGYIALVGAFKIGGHLLLVADPRALFQQRRAHTLSLVVRAATDKQQVEMGLNRVMSLEYG
jgi:hypothetical protein